MTDNSAKSFGRYLRSIRLEKGISLEDIAAATRINWETLLRIEDEQHEQLPAEVFVKGFIRSYAKTVGADGDIAVRSYEKSLAAFQLANAHQSELMRARNVFWPRLAMGLLLLTIIVAGSIYTLSKGSSPAVNPPTEVQTTVAATTPPMDSSSHESTAAEVSTPKEMVPASAEPTSPEAAPAVSPPAAAPPVTVMPTVEAPVEAPAELKQRLSINAVEETWMKIITDGIRASEYMLKPGDHLQLEAEKSFNLLIGNAAGVTIELNGQPLPIRGRSGQVLTLQVP